MIYNMLFQFFLFIIYYLFNNPVCLDLPFVMVVCVCKYIDF
jgi:hypothetical protein